MRIARPSSSIESRRFPFGVNPSRIIFFRCANGRVCDLLLYRSAMNSGVRLSIVIYLTRSNTVTLFPTGESRQVPSGLNTKFP